MLVGRVVKGGRNLLAGQCVLAPLPCAGNGASVRHGALLRFHDHLVLDVVS